MLDKSFLNFLDSLVIIVIREIYAQITKVWKTHLAIQIDESEIKRVHGGPVS